MRTLRPDPKKCEQQLREADLFADIPAAALAPLLEVIATREYEQGEMLFWQDEPAAGFFVLNTGGLHVYRTGMDGRRQILHVFDAPGDVCGEVPVFEGSTYPASAEALGPCRALYVPRTDFLRVTRQHPELLLAMLAVLSRRLRRFVGLIDDLSLKDVGSRLAAFLLEQAAEAGRPSFRLGMSKSLLAARVGTIAETVSRTLRKMQTQEYLAVQGREITILDADGLRCVAEGEVRL